MSEPTDLRPVLDTPGAWIGSFVIFVPAETQPGHTKKWQVQAAKDRGLLGMIAWFSPWRRYAFYPAPETVFEQTCMRELAQFVEERTSDHRPRAR